MSSDLPEIAGAWQLSVSNFGKRLLIDSNKKPMLIRIERGMTLSENVRDTRVDEKQGWLPIDDFHVRNVSAAVVELGWEQQISRLISERNNNQRK